MNDRKQQPKRKRGGQPGNQNARTHGLYSRTRTPAELAHLEAARGMVGIDDEIALMRVKIRSILTLDPHNTTALDRAMSVLIRLVRLSSSLSSGAGPGLGLEDDLARALRRMSAPPGKPSRGSRKTPDEAIRKNESMPEPFVEKAIVPSKAPL